VLITTISQTMHFNFQLSVLNKSLANDLQRYHYVMTLLVGAHHY